MSESSSPIDKPKPPVVPIQPQPIANSCRRTGPATRQLERWPPKRRFALEHDDAPAQLFAAGLLALLVCLLPDRALAQFSFQLDDHQLHLAEQGRAGKWTPVLSYVYRPLKPPGEATTRAGYVHPLYGLDGDQLTDDFPADHRHHRGMYFAWPQMNVLGQDVDVWHLRGIRPHFKSWGERHANQDSASFSATQLWKLDDGQDVIREVVAYTVHAARDDGRFIDVEARLTNLTEQPITLGGQVGKGYGGFNIRLDGSRPDVRIHTANGPLNAAADRVDPPSPWASHSSRFTDRQRSGVAIFQHPANPDFIVPTWTLRAYGFLAAAWPGVKQFSLKPQQPLRLRYRVFVFRGDAETAQVAKKYRQYSENQQTNADASQRISHPDSRIAIDKNDDSGELKISIDGRHAVSYQFGSEFAIPHLYPVLSPAGRNLIVQQDQPFPHHRGIWIADDVQLDGGPRVDFYHDFKNLKQKNDYTSGFHHAIRHQKFTALSVDQDRAAIGMESRWIANQGTADETPILDEQRHIDVVALADGEYLLDLKWELIANYGEVHFRSDAVHYAWPYLRMHPQFSGEQGGSIVDNQGRNGQAETNMQVARWICYSNSFKTTAQPPDENTTEGISVFLPDGPRRWLTREYGTFGPRRTPALSGKPFSLKQGESVAGRVGILIHRGDAVAGRIGDRYHQFTAGASTPAPGDDQPHD